ncbi:uncharacterized protein TOT_040000387 [Theileria orientalis strain Shintoku]|uniref:Uncharacterized protein n=1 Tax=Theileria orientalis strain Shintoku TaxID=869250 RepID=J4DAI6_THEOR|nr:uncharacterized protein TOT_040000387 [Theileria orientalis strain Shintoku]PVC54553.1 hypothetical protein MACL_00003008 [Theileria orientalis]BAM42010.1 uncharacterized protein TOT_040000387 [Theileria orientalis strain Shintoku]|eukprot:XP_009692311.1 uncharacterized protein TOT_040000387 [Theileria orientalis strain Shintoku]
MTKCNKKFKRKPRGYKCIKYLISKDVNRLFINFINVQNQCDCGCSRTIKSIQSLLLQKYLCSKQRWIKLLCVRRNRILELSGFSDLIVGMESSLEFDSLDLNLVKSDTSRQQWLLDRDKTDLVERAIYTFCLYNNVAYWQGIHDVAAALAHLDPTPTVGELAVLLEYLVKNYAPFLYSKTTSEVTARANELSARWRLLFKYFFPKASNDYDQFCESSFSIGWFMTLGFYRFGCAYISLAYTFLLIISRHDCMSSFMFRDLGYIAARGYINYLTSRRIPVDFNNSVIFSNFSNSSLIVNTLVNSNKIVLEPEEFINVSKHLYDTFDGRDFELSEFPLLYIFTSANILKYSAPSVQKIDSEKEFVEITEPDLFSKANRFQSLQSTMNPTSESHEIKYRSRKHVSGTVRRRIRRAHMLHRNSLERISDLVNAEITYSYILSFKPFGCLRRYGRIGGFGGPEDDNFVYGNVLNQNILYNILDLRSPYLCSGISLDKIFGTSKTTFLKNVNAQEVYEGCLLDTSFTLWIVLTDEGYEADEDSNALMSLNRGLELMESLSKNSITCVTMFRGGYKAILKSLNLPLPLPPSILSRISVRRILPWNVGNVAENSPSTHLTAIATSIGSAAMGIEQRIVKGISDMSIFSRFRHSQIQQIVTNVDEEVRTEWLREKKYAPLARPDQRNKISYSIKLSAKEGTEVSIKSNGTVKVNGIILHPSQYTNAVSDPSLSIFMSLSTLFTVNCVDGLLDVECRSYGVGKWNTRVAEFFKLKADEMLSSFSIIVCPPETLLSDTLIRPLTVVTNVAGVCSKTTLNGLYRKWNVYIINRQRLIRHLLKCVRIWSQSQEPQEESGSSLGFMSVDANNGTAIGDMRGTTSKQVDSVEIITRLADMCLNNAINTHSTNIAESNTTNARNNISSVVRRLNSFQRNVSTPNAFECQLTSRTDLVTNNANHGRNVYRAVNTQRGLRVFSRTHEPRAHESSSRSSASNVEARLVPAAHNPNKQIPIYYKGNVFSSRSTLNKRQKSNE